jgi:hypothetical protein
MGAPSASPHEPVVFVSIEDPWDPEGPNITDASAMVWELVEIHLHTGATRVLYRDPGHRCNHIVPNPRVPHLLLIDRDPPPRFSHYGDGGLTPRVWILDTRDGSVIPVNPRAEHKFQIHNNWNHDGTHVYYHGVAGPKGETFMGRSTTMPHYIGVAGLDGVPVWEGRYPSFHYGHVGSHPAADRIIIDGLLTPDLVLALDWKTANPDRFPKLEVLARHGTNWALGGQKSHPHCHISRNGRWLAFNKAEQETCTVCLVDLAS